MSNGGERDVWAELVLGAPRPFVDPETGEVVMEQPVIRPGKRKAVDTGYVMLNMEAMVTVGQHLNMPAALILMEAARQWRMGNGAVALTRAFGNRLGLTEWQRRSAVAELSKLGEATGWVRVTQAGHRAPEVRMATEGMRRLWRAGKSAALPE
jgi:hypothetical protein